MESLAYLHLAVAYETSKLSESGIKLEQTQNKVLQAEISNEISNISSLSRIQLIPKFVPSFKLNFLIRIKAIALALVLILSSSVCALLVRGNYGKEVVTLQNNLKQLDYFPKNLPSTGYFDGVTEASVGKFQKANGLVVDGKVGVNTTQSLKKALHTSHKNPNKVSRTPILKLGSKGEQVVELKYRLVTLASLGIDDNTFRDNRDTFDEATEKAVKKFQKNNNLKIDGIVGVKTNEALLEARWPSSLSGRALFNRGLKQPYFWEALLDYNEAIKRDKNLAEAYYRRGMLYAYADEIEIDAQAGIDRDINKASNDFSEAIKINPDYVEAYLERGIIHNEKKNWKSAIDDWTQAILIEPDNIEAYYRRAKAKEQLKNTESAINDYIEVITRKLTSEQDTLLKAQVEEAIYNFKKRKVDGKLMLALLRGLATANVSDIFFRKEYGSRTEEDSVGGSDEEKASNIAIKGLEDEINNNKNFEGKTYQKLLLYYKGLNQYQSNENQPNQEAYFSSSPFASAYYYQGLLFLLKGDDTQAKKAFDETIEREPNFTKAYYLRGIIRSKQGDEQGAISDFKKYLQGDSEMEEAKKMRDYKKIRDNPIKVISKAQEVCFNQEIPKEYLETLESSVSLDASAYLRRGKLRFLLGDYPGAKKDFQEAIKADPSLAADAYYQKGRVAAYEFYLSDINDIKKYQEAKESFDEAIKINTNLSEAYFERGYLKYQMNITNQYASPETNNFALIDDSQNDFKQAIKVDKSFAQAYYLMVVAERYKYRMQTEKKGGDRILYKTKISPTEINNLTEAIRSDIYFYSDFIGAGRLTIKRAICVDLGNSKQDNTIKPVSIIPFQSKKESGYYTLALDNYRKKEYKQAIENISKAIKLNPNISDYYVIRGAAYYFYKSKNNEYYKEPLEDFRKSIELDSEYSISDYAAGGEIPEITYSRSISNVLKGRILGNQGKNGSQIDYQIALRSLPQADWLIDKYGGGGGQTQNTATSSSAKVPSKKCP